MAVKYGDKKLKVGIFGTGWWSKFQIPAWLEIGNLDIAALYNRTVSKAEATKAKLGLNCNVYSDPEELLKNEQIDFADIITETNFHKPLVLLTSKYSVPIVCQKPVAFTYEDCLEMWQACKNKDIPLIINENYRWRSSIRQMKKIIESGEIGTPFRSVIKISNCGPEQLKNQPFLKTLRHYALFDIGVHGFDIARYLFGEPDRVYCQALRTVDFISGDDMALAMLTYKDSICNVQLTDMFTNMIEVEGLNGLIELTTDNKIRIIKKQEEIKEYDYTNRQKYNFIEPDDESILGTEQCDAIVQAQRNILEELRYGKMAETTMSEYIKTMEITFSAIHSTLTGKSVSLYRY